MDLNLGTNWPWLAGGAAAIAGGWGLFRSVFDWLSTLLVGRIKCSSAIVPVQWFVWNKCTKLPVGVLNSYWDTFSRDGSKREHIAFEELEKDAVLTFYGWVPLLFKKTEDGNTTIISYIRGTLNPEKLLKTIQRAYSARPIEGRFRVIYTHGYANSFGRGNEGRLPGATSEPPSKPSATHNGVDLYPGFRPITHSMAELMSSTGVTSVEDLSLDDDVLDAIKEVREWLKLKDWYKEKGIPWRRGWLLTGKPGTGKSTLVKSLAKTMDLPVVYFDLSTFLNTCFMDAWKEQSVNTPFIALFEDIDAVFNKRENLNKTFSGGLTFDCFLNAIAGADTTDGVFTVITTNDITKIDPALAVFDERGGTSRPGRIDRILNLRTMSTASLEKIAHRILRDHSEASINEIVQGSPDFTAAQFTEKCVRIALKEKWNKC